MHGSGTIFASHSPRTGHFHPPSALQGQLPSPTDQGYASHAEAASASDSFATPASSLLTSPVSSPSRMGSIASDAAISGGWAQRPGDRLTTSPSSAGLHLLIVCINLIWCCMTCLKQFCTARSNHTLPEPLAVQFEPVLHCSVQALYHCRYNLKANLPYCERCMSCLGSSQVHVAVWCDGSHLVVKGCAALRCSQMGPPGHWRPHVQSANHPYRPPQSASLCSAWPQLSPLPRLPRRLLCCTPHLC